MLDANASTWGIMLGSEEFSKLYSVEYRFDEPVKFTTLGSFEIVWFRSIKAFFKASEYG
jgi:hypothetical protein